MPERIQRKRTKGHKHPPGTVFVDRSTRFGNPVRVTEDRTRAEAKIAFRAWLLATGPMFEEERRQWILANLDRIREADYVACFCPLGVACHVDVLIELANKAEENGKLAN